MEKQSIAIGGEDQSDMIFPPSKYTITFAAETGVGEVMGSSSIKSKQTSGTLNQAKQETNTVGLEACQFQEEEKKKQSKPKENKAFLKYFQDQKILGEQELQLMYQKMKERLPLSFRVSCLEQDAGSIISKLKSLAERIKEKGAGSKEEKKEKLMKEIEWIKQGGAYQVDQLSRVTLRKDPDFKRFHQYLVALTECGKVLRQEAISMLPPLCFPKINSESIVLDMCAAPGSKTCQLLELMGAQGGIPQGVVIANDLNRDRAYLLVHRARRLASPALMVANDNALTFPPLKVGTQIEKTLEFDAVLCDVVCSGDGTLRKNLGLWKHFHPRQGLLNHSLQLKIAKKGASLLRPGGTLIYSTCSLNPLENEAVVANLLESNSSLSLEALQDSSTLKSQELKVAPGLIKWRVPYYEGRGKNLKEAKWFTSHEEVQVANSKNPKFSELLSSLPRTLFHPIYTHMNTQPVSILKDPLNLSKCARIYPHLMNTGGFFVAAIKNNKEQGDHEDGSEDEEVEEEKNQGSREHVTMKEELSEFLSKISASVDALQGPMTPMLKEIKKECEEKVEEPKRQFLSLVKYQEKLWKEIKSFYGINDHFRSDLLYYRTEGMIRGIHFVSPTVKAILQSRRVQGINIIHAGVMLFERADRQKSPDCAYRLTQEGLRWIVPFLSKRIFQIQVQTLEQFMKAKLHILHFDEIQPEMTRLFLKASAKGSAVLKQNNTFFAIWIGVNHVTLMLSKEDTKAYSLS